MFNNLSGAKAESAESLKDLGNAALGSGQLDAAEALYRKALAADDLEAATAYIAGQTGRSKLLLYGTSSGAQKGGLFAMRHPERVARLALDAMFWTGRDSPDLKQRMAQLPELLAVNRRPFDPAVIAKVFERDGPGLAEPELVEAFGRAVA